MIDIIAILFLIAVIVTLSLLPARKTRQYNELDIKHSKALRAWIEEMRKNEGIK